MMQVINAGGQKFAKIYDWTDTKILKGENKKPQEQIVEKVETSCCRM